jgi:hypothetical protein
VGDDPPEEESMNLARPGRMLGAALMLAALAASPALAADTRIDPAGDARGSAPDVTSVTVESEDGELVIGVAFAPGAAPAWSDTGAFTDSVMVFGNLEPGGPAEWPGSNGFSISIRGVTPDAPVAFIPVHGRISGDPRFDVATATVDADSVTLRLPWSEIGDPGAIGITVMAVREAEGEIATDMFPADEQFATYDVAALDAAGAPAPVSEAPDAARSDAVAPSLLAIALGAGLLVAVVAIGRSRPGPWSHRGPTPA